MRNTGATFEGVRPIGSVFLIISYHKCLWIFLIYSLYIPYIFPKYVPYFSLVCFLIYSVNRFKPNFLIRVGGVTKFEISIILTTPFSCVICLTCALVTPEKVGNLCAVESVRVSIGGRSVRWLVGSSVRSCAGLGSRPESPHPWHAAPRLLELYVGNQSQDAVKF